MRRSEQLRFKKALSSGELEKASGTLRDSPELPRLFPQYLVLLHQIIRASVPLMEAARSEALKLDRSDPLRQPLADYLGQHIEEERDHDEWTLQDLTTIGLGREEILGRIPSPAVASLVGCQYYWLHHHHPVALLGYISVLEGDPGSSEIYDDLERRTGLPKSLFRTYRMHGELDPDHIEELDELIDTLPLSEDQFSLIGISAMYTNLKLGECISDMISQ